MGFKLHAITLSVKEGIVEVSVVPKSKQLVDLRVVKVDCAVSVAVGWKIDGV